MGATEQKVGGWGGVVGRVSVRPGGLGCLKRAAPWVEHPITTEWYGGWGNDLCLLVKRMGVLAACPLTSRCVPLGRYYLGQVV